MKKQDIITIIVFIFLIIAIIAVVSINSYKTRKLTNVDRKIEYIYGFTYDSVLNKGESLFSLTMELLNNKNVFEYEENLDNSVKHFAINNTNNYMKIKNFSIAINNFSDNGLKEYMDYKKIIYFENDYYIEDKKVNKNNYLGSMIDIINYQNNIVKFKAQNYYCDNHDYIGVLYETPTCDYETNEITFDVLYEGNTFKMASINNIITIMQ